MAFSLNSLPKNQETEEPLADLPKSFLSSTPLSASPSEFPKPRAESRSSRIANVYPESRSLGVKLSQIDLAANAPEVAAIAMAAALQTRGPLGISSA